MLVELDTVDLVVVQSNLGSCVVVGVVGVVVRWGYRQIVIVDVGWVRMCPPFLTSHCLDPHVDVDGEARSSLRYPCWTRRRGIVLEIQLRAARNPGWRSVGEGGLEA